MIKRITADIINLVLFLVIVIILFPLLNYLRINLNSQYFLSVVFCIVFFIPITFLQTTVGYKILNIKIDNRRKLFIKYFIYLFVFTGAFHNLCMLLFELDVLRVYKSYSLNFSILYFQFSLLIVNIFMFLFSGGKYNLLDYVLKISFSYKKYKVKEIVILLIWLFSIYFTLFFTIISSKYSFEDSLKSLIYPSNEIVLTGYFPKETFDDYSFIQLEKYENSNDVISYSNKESFFSDRFLKRKTIYSLINKSTFSTEGKRLVLCHLLYKYSIYNDIFSGINDVDQTEIILMYKEAHTYYSRMCYVYRYYKEKDDINGGIELDSISSFHKNNILCYEDALRKVLGSRKDSLDKKLSEEGKISYQLSLSETQEILKNYHQDPRHQDYIVTSIIPFSDVKPSKWFALNFPYQDLQTIEVNSYLLRNEKLEDAVYYRNSSLSIKEMLSIMYNNLERAYEEFNNNE